MDTAQGLREKADVNKVKLQRRPPPCCGLGSIKERRLFFLMVFFDSPARSSGVQGAEEDLSTTGFGAESEREVPTGPDPIHHHARGPRRQSP